MGFTSEEELTSFFICVLLLELLHNRSGQNVDWLHCHAAVSSFWMSLIVVSHCYLCSSFLAVPFGSTIPVNSSCALLTFICFSPELCTRLFSFMVLLSCFSCCVIIRYKMIKILRASVWCHMVQSNKAHLLFNRNKNSVITDIFTFKLFTYILQIFSLFNSSLVILPHSHDQGRKQVSCGCYPYLLWFSMVRAEPDQVWWFPAGYISPQTLSLSLSHCRRPCCINLNFHHRPSN